MTGQLPALPNGYAAGTGYDWMDALTGTGWCPIASWGRDGWDLGDWPLVVVVTCSVRPSGPYGVATYVEGDLEVQAFNTHEERIAAIDQIARFYWRLRHSNGPADLPPVGPALPRHCGPFSWARLNNEVTDNH